jgi:uncharacterized membrane protein
MSERGEFWGGFALGALVGAAAGLGAYAAACAAAGDEDSRVLRIERSIQVARPQREVFAAWRDLNGLSQMVDRVRAVRNGASLAGRGRSRWNVEVAGREFAFEAETTQLIPNEAIGWKSVSGPKHTGRVNFAKLGEDTLVHVTMNYHPPLGRLGRLLAPLEKHLERAVEESLRDFKEATEGHGQGRKFRLDAESAAQEAMQRPRHEADGELLEQVRGGEQGIDRGRIQADQNEEYSPSSPTSYGKHGPQSAGWDEERSAKRATGTDESNPVDYTRPPKASY